MRKTRRLFYLASGVSAVMGIIAACSFPEPRVLEADPSEAGGDSSEDTTTGEDGDVDSGVDATTDVTPPITDATTEKPAVDAADGCCDCDDDGYLAKDAEARCKDSGKPSGDCDDLDKRANPDAGFITDQPTTDTLGDWNCDGKVNGEFTPKINCPGRTGGLINNNCDGEKGFVDNPGCGVENAYVECKTSGAASCTESATEFKKQGCK